MAAPLSKLQRRARRTLRIALAWVAAGVLAALWESNVMAHQGLDPHRSAVLKEHLSRALFAGLIGGGIYIFVMRDRLRRLAYLPAFFIMSLLMFVAVAVVYAVIPVMIADDPASELPMVARLFSWPLLGHFLFWDLLMGVTMLMVRLNDQFGSGTAGFLLGRYSKPRQELRIFMFLDMRSSTAIAEEIGDTRYFQLLNEVYADITDPVIYSEGDIYQYVGDEISVSWQLQRGIKDQRCVRCFFAIQEKLRQRAEHYRQRYGIAPVFKAGFHFGQVTTGEIGLVKKQTIFSGDAVNTAAHIQASCNEYGVDNLLSKDLIDVLLLPPDRWTVRSIGEVPLKGKRRTMALFTIAPVVAS